MANPQLTLDALREAVQGTAAAFRCRRRLQPAGGEGDKVFPPTFAGAVYAVERRRIAGRTGPVHCVLLDSVQSQANRMELALQEAADTGRLKLPLVVVDFTDYDPTGDLEADERAGRLLDAVGRLTSLQLPHRLADAILRDSELEGTPFRKSERGKALNRVSVANATPLFELCPTALVFGMWDSTGPKGGLGPKFERAMVSEIVGVGAEWDGDYRARGVRRDPLEISKNVLVLRNEDKSLRKVAEGRERGVRPSEINHSSVPFDSPNSGVTVEYAEQTTTLSLIVLRRLRFPLNGAPKAEADVAARTALAALGLCGATLAAEAGMGLRSRCLLWPEGPMTWELLDRPGEQPKTFSLSASGALTLLTDAVAQARAAGLPWPEEALELEPSEELVKLVRLSQLELVKEGSEAA
jgi:CRISPR-associated protein Csb1